MKEKFCVVMVFVLSLLPFAIGSIQNWYILICEEAVLPYGLISLVVLLLWGCIAFLFNGRNLSTKTIVISLNLIAALDLLLIGIQELILHSYWMNFVGSWSQLFYLPMLNLGFRLTNWSHSMFVAYVACFGLMVAVSLTGCKLRRKFQKIF